MSPWDKNIVEIMAEIIILEASEIYELLEATGAFSVRIWDSRYVLPTKQWLDGLGSFYRLWRLHNLGPENVKYRENAGDCDKFALFATVCVQTEHLKTPAKLTDGIAFGECVYTRDDGGVHAINVVVCPVDGSPTVVFWEPQTQQEVKLSFNELSGAEIRI